jgi:hypothetical protein
MHTPVKAGVENVGSEEVCDIFATNMSHDLWHMFTG